jgi:hypothetical protein
MRCLHSRSCSQTLMSPGTTSAVLIKTSQTNFLRKTLLPMTTQVGQWMHPCLPRWVTDYLRILPLFALSLHHLSFLFSLFGVVSRFIQLHAITTLYLPIRSRGAIPSIAHIHTHTHTHTHTQTDKHTHTHTHTHAHTHTHTHTRHTRHTRHTLRAGSHRRATKDL